MKTITEILNEMILKNKKEIEKNTKEIEKFWNQLDAIKIMATREIDKSIERYKKIKNKTKKLEIAIIFLFITNLTTIFLLWR